MKADLNVIEQHDIQDEGHLSLDEWNDYTIEDFKNMGPKDLFRFCKANKEFGEPGIAYDELRALWEAFEACGNGPMTILETGQCFGTTTRFFVVKTLQNGGEHFSCEIRIRDLFKEKMKAMNLWDKFTTIGNSQTCPWPEDKGIGFLFIDSEHAMSNALGEYMRFRPYLHGEAIIGFHDTECCYGVGEAIKTILKMDAMEKVSESVNAASAGVKFFRLTGRGVNEHKANMAAYRKDHVMDEGGAV